jgi:S-adenosylmethionine uptake transporter
MGISFMLVATVCMSVNDMLIKQLSGAYPLHQMVFVRSVIGLMFSLVLVQLEGGWSILRPRRPWLHVLRGLLVVVSNLSYFAALAVMPLASATALFFVAPLFITILSVPFLGEKVGIRRAGAVLIGFVGVLIMVRPGSELGADLGAESYSRWVLALPILAAFTYAAMQILTRKLGVNSKASAMALYIQAIFLIVSTGFFLIAGDGHFAAGQSNESLIFLLRAWTWPTPQDLPLFVLLGMVSAGIGYCLSAAYRSGDAATIAPYEYVAMPLAVMWGFVVFGTLPGLNSAVGIALIMAAGLYVFLRERARKAQERRAVARAAE